MKSGFKVAGRRRLLRARFTANTSLGLMGTCFSAEQEPPLSRTDTGLEVCDSSKYLPSLDLLQT